MKLNEFLAASLPYRLWVRFWDVNNKNNKNYSIASPYRIGNYYDEFESEICRAIPFVRPLSDLTKPIIQKDYNGGEPFVPIEIICEQYKHVRPHLLIPAIKTGMVDFNIALLLLRWHFDLLDEGIEKVLVTDEFNPY